MIDFAYMSLPKIFTVHLIAKRIGTAHKLRGSFVGPELLDFRMSIGFPIVPAALKCRRERREQVTVQSNCCYAEAFSAFKRDFETKCRIASRSGGPPKKFFRS